VLSRWRALPLAGAGLGGRASLGSARARLDLPSCHRNTPPFLTQQARRSNTDCRHQHAWLCICRPSSTTAARALDTAPTCRLGDGRVDAKQQQSAPNRNTPIQHQQSRGWRTWHSQNVFHETGLRVAPLAARCPGSLLYERPPPRLPTQLASLRGLGSGAQCAKRPLHANRSPHRMSAHHGRCPPAAGANPRGRHRVTQSILCRCWHCTLTSTVRRV
jgi:hypothetical protein